MTKTSSSCEGTPGMNNDDTEPVRSAVTAIVNSFVITHSIIITVIVAVFVLAVALSLGNRVPPLS